MSNESPITNNGSRPAQWQVAIVAGLFLAIAFGLMVATLFAGRYVDLPNAPHPKLQCASYTPSHNGHMLDEAEKRRIIRSDLVTLAERFNCVRTYSVSEGLDEVPKIARTLELQVILGMWIGSNAANNDAEVARGIQLANEYSDIVTAVVVGNEVLLRRELTAEQLQSLLDRVRAGTNVPVTYADVWEFWLRNKKLADSASFVTIHILPYWEDNPIGIDHALDHVKNIYGKVRAEFPNKRILIGETGWPSEGRPRMKAVPSLVNEARFIREFVAYAESNRIPYNIIEAYDQPWKRVQEGTVGGFWGLYDANGAEKFQFVGSVSGRKTWRIELGVVLGTSIVFALWGWALRPRPSFRALAFLAIAGHAAGSIACSQWRYLVAANRSWLEWTSTLAWSLSGWLFYVLSCIIVVRWMDGSGLVERPAPISAVLRETGHGAQNDRSMSRKLGMLRTLILCGASYVCLALAYEGRGRDFPLALFALPAVMMLVLECLALWSATGNSHERESAAENTNSAQIRRLPQNEEWLFAICLACCSIYIAWTETIANLRAWGWCGLCLLTAIVLVGLPLRRQLGTSSKLMHPDQRSEQQSGTA